MSTGIKTIFSFFLVSKVLVFALQEYHQKNYRFQSRPGEAALCFHMHHDTKNLLIFVSKEELLICSRLRGQCSAKQEIEILKIRSRQIENYTLVTHSLLNF